MISNEVRFICRVNFRHMLKSHEFQIFTSAQLLVGQFYFSGGAGRGPSGANTPLVPMLTYALPTLGKSKYTSLQHSNKGSE